MTESESESTKVAVLSSEVSTLKIAMGGIGGKLDAIDAKVDAIAAKVDKAEGILAFVRFIGVGGVVVGLYAVARANGAPLP